MRCDDCRLLIEDYFDGELESQAALEIKRHLDECSSCSRVLKSLSVEQAAYSSYEVDFEVSPQLWAGVQRRLATETKAPPPRIVRRLQAWLRSVFALPPVSGPATVGLVVLAVVLTVVVMRYVAEPGKVMPQQSVGNAPQGMSGTAGERVAVKPEVKEETPVPDVSGGSDIEAKPARTTKASARTSLPATNSSLPKTKTPSQLVREAEQKYLTAIAMLSKDFSRKRSRLDPATVAELNQALASIDETIANTRKVVRRHPDDPVAAQYMLTAYARKVGVLREIVED